MPAPKYGASLTGLGINLLGADVSAAVSFATDVFGAETVYADSDFAVLKLGEIEWKVQPDHTYDKHSLLRMSKAGAPTPNSASAALISTRPKPTRARRAIPISPAPWTRHTACARHISSIRTATAGFRTSR